MATSNTNQNKPDFTPSVLKFAGPGRTSLFFVSIPLVSNYIKKKKENYKTTIFKVKPECRL